MIYNQKMVISMFLIWLTYILAYLYRRNKTEQKEEKDILLDDAMSLEDWIVESHPVESDNESLDLNRDYHTITRRATI